MHASAHMTRPGYLTRGGRLSAAVSCQRAPLRPHIGYTQPTGAWLLRRSGGRRQVSVTPSRTVVVGDEVVGVVWPARGGGYTLRTGTRLARAKIHHFSPAEGLPGLLAYLEKRFGAAPRFVPALDIDA